MTDETKDYAAEGIAQMNAARNFPVNTCPSSRHVGMIAEALAGGGRYPMIEEDPKHVAGSLATVVTSLWEARTFLAGLGYTWTTDGTGVSSWVLSDKPEGEDPGSTGPVPGTPSAA